MKLQDIMTRDVEVIEPHATLQDAAEKMKLLDVGLLPVATAGRLVGVITDRDIAVRSTARGNDPFGDRVRDAMTDRVVSCFEDQDVAEAAETMKQHQVRRLPVVDRDGRLVGIVALADLAVEAGDKRPAAEALQGVSEPARRKR